MNKVVKGRAFLEERQEGAFEALCDYVMGRDGVLHLAPDCFLAGYMLEDEPGVFHVVFQCSELPALYRQLVALGCDVVEWRRDFGHGDGYGVRRRKVEVWGRKLGLAEFLNKKVN